MKYRATVSRVVHDVQWRTVDVEAENMGAAEDAALEQANTNDGFWDDAESTPLASDEPQLNDETELLRQRAGLNVAKVRHNTEKGTDT